jgi:hypothetical protein
LRKHDKITTEEGCACSIKFSIETLHLYVRNDPENLVDPDGRNPDDPGTWIFGGPSNFVMMVPK